MQPLKGLKVVDLTKVLAGPLCGQYLGEYGADVIKVETVGGDDTRRWLPQVQGESAIFVAVNHNKRSIAVDLKTQQGRDIVHRLVKDADIVLQGFGGGTAKKLGVDYETLCALNDRLIYCEISGFGRNGPLGNVPGYDVMLQAFSGMLSTMGQPEGDYARASFSPVDIGTAMNTLSGVLAAVIGLEALGVGFALDEDAEGDPIDPAARYRLDPEQGPRRLTFRLHRQTGDSDGGGDWLIVMREVL